MSLEPDRWHLPAEWPRHKLRAYGQAVNAPTGAEYKRLLNFLSRTVTLGERAILDTRPVPEFAQVPLIVNRRMRASAWQAQRRTIESTPISFPMPSSIINMGCAVPVNEKWVDAGSAEKKSTTFAAEMEALASMMRTAADAFDETALESNGTDLISGVRAEGDYGTDLISGVRAEGDYGTDLIWIQETSVDELSVTVNYSEEEQVLVTSAATANPNSNASEEDGQFLSHLATLLNEWFGRENQETREEEEEETAEEEIEDPQDSHARRRERFLNRLTASSKSEEEAVAKNKIADDMRKDASKAEGGKTRKSKAHRNPPVPATVPLADGRRREVFQNGSFVEKDAVGHVTEVRTQDGLIMSFSYDDKGHLKSFVRSDKAGKIYTTGVKDRHGVVVRDESGSVRAQGDSMTVDGSGCVSIRKFDGQFWSLDVLRGIHIERRILEDADGGWNSLTALLTCDGFRMVTRFQKLQEDNRQSYRKYGDWLASSQGSRFRFYGRDGSMIQFDSDEDLEAMRPSRIWPPGSRVVEREWKQVKGVRARLQAGSAWEAVNQYISQYLSAL